MKKPNELAKDEAAMATLVEVTSAFEGIASIRIAQTKTRVLQSTEFFRELWGIYKQLRVKDAFNFGRSKSDNDKLIQKELYIIITAEGGFSGDIDLKLINFMLESYNKDKNDIIVIGHHGAIQLAQRGIEYKKYYKLPVHDQNINTMPVVAEIQKYRSTVIFYQEYETLMVQDVKSIELVSAVEDRGVNDNPDEIINERTYLFEPDAYAVAAHLERSIMQITISQLILNSKLAQYASRFRAMTASRERSEDERQDIHLMYNRSKRAVKDERLKEIINGLKKTKTGVAG
ncbi:MAG: F0F1 ATP synthase subunit gamma [Candidatus Saccharimonadales bacterium]